MTPNPSIERTSESQLRWLCAAAHVELQGLPHLSSERDGDREATSKGAIGRSNYLFMGSDEGGHRAASLYSLLETAKLNGLDPQAYLHEVLERIAEHPINGIAELLPWNIERQHDQRKAA